MPLGAFRLNTLAKSAEEEISYRPVEVTSLGNGGITVNTATKLYGTGSAYTNGINRYLDVGNIPLGSGDFTIEFWLAPSSMTGNLTLIDFREQGGSNTQNLPTIYVSGSKIYYYKNGANQANSTYYNVLTGNFKHCAVVRHNGTITVYYRGYYSDSASQVADSTDYGVLPLVIGVNAASIGRETYPTDDYNGYIDELRISNIARYTGQPGSPGDYSPTGPFTNDENTLLLLHMDGTNGSTTFEDDNS